MESISAYFERSSAAFSRLVATTTSVHVTAQHASVRFSRVAGERREANELRDEMGRIDAQLLDALDKRARVARQLRELRKDQPASLPLTNDALIGELVSRSTGDMPREALASILREVYAACLALELPVAVAYAGPESGPDHAAARRRFGGGARLVPTDNVAHALDEVSHKRAEFAIVPFETASDGTVHSTVLALAPTELRIAEVFESERVRYAVVGTRPAGRSASDVTAVVFSVQDSPGALLDVLRVFAERSLNLTNVLSHPVEGKDWTYLFYLEIAGHFTDRALVTAFEEMKRLTRFFKLLGSYPSP
jgi:chorismate mutase